MSASPESPRPAATGAGQMTEAERVRLLDDAVRGARRGAVARFASSLSHALGTPLNVIAGRAAMIGMGEANVEEMRENARIIETQVKNITELLQRALKFVRNGAPPAEPTDLRALVQRVAGALAPLAESRRVTLSVVDGEPAYAVVPASRVCEVVAALASWAVARAPADGSVSIALRSAQVEPPPLERGRARGGQSIVVDVACSGISLPESLLEHVYEPWLAGSAEDRDTALTLAVAFGVAREHRGFVDVHRDGERTELSVCWPV